MINLASVVADGTMRRLLGLPALLDTVVDEGDETSRNNNTKVLVRSNHRKSRFMVTYSATSVMASIMLLSLIQM